MPDLAPSVKCVWRRWRVGAARWRIALPHTGPGHREAGRLALRHPGANRSELLWTAVGANTMRLGETLLRAKESSDFGSLLARTLLAPGCRDYDVARAALLTLEDEWGLIPIALWEVRW